MSSNKHTPVLLQQSIEALAIKPGGHYVDATFGQGGHTRAILDKGGEVLAIDADRSQISNIQFPISKEKIYLVEGNYSDIEKIVKESKFDPVDGLLFDLGLSMRQLSDSGKGFSFKNDAEPLDMRLSDDFEYTAADILRYSSAEDLYEIFAKYSETLYSQQFADAVVRTRTINKVETVGELKRVIDTVLMQMNYQRSKTEIYAQIFQALRIAVNQEYQHIRQGLQGSWNIIKEGGILAVITFHSGEDRIVKLEARKIGFTEVDKPIKGKFKFERSAKLRTYIKNA